MTRPGHTGTSAGGAGIWRRERGTVLRQAVTPEDRGPAVIHPESEVPTVPTEWSPHAHAMHELVWVRGGTLSSRVGNRVFTVAPGWGLWLPAGVTHGGRLTAKVEFFNAFFAPEHSLVTFTEPTSVSMTPLLESLLARLARTDLAAGARARTEAVVFDVLAPADRPLALDLPGDPRIDPIAQALLRDPADDRGLRDWAAQMGVSDRTVTRAFRDATGLPFAQWRQALRIHTAVGLLAEGVPVGEVARRLGYGQASTFIAAFRRVMRTTPGAVTLAPHRNGPNRASGVPSAGLPSDQSCPNLKRRKVRQT